MFESLDFVYLPSRDVAVELQKLSEGLNATVVFAIEAFGTRVAMLELSDSPPSLLLAEHLEGDQPVLVYRVPDLDEAVAGLERRGVAIEARFDIPHGPAAQISMPGPQRIALYQLTRPEAKERLGGRRDF